MSYRIVYVVLQVDKVPSFGLNKTVLLSIPVSSICRYLENVTNEGEQAEETDADEEKLIEQLMEVLAAGDSEECSICLDNLNNAVITRCLLLILLN